MLLSSNSIKTPLSSPLNSEPNPLKFLTCKDLSFEVGEIATALVELPMTSEIIFRITRY